MSENKLKPKIEDAAPDYLDGDNLDNLLDFVVWLRANKMNPSFGSKSKIGISYTTSVLFVKLFHDFWYIWISGTHRKHRRMYINDFLSCDELKEIVGESLARGSESCAHKCNGGQCYTVTVCGKKFERICHCCTVRFCNPDADTLRIIKRVIESRNNAK